MNERIDLRTAIAQGIDPVEWYMSDPNIGISIDQQMKQLLIRAEAKKQYDRLIGAAFSEPLVESLDTALARERDPVTYRIDHHMVVGHNTNIAASYKVGKTTLLVNRLRSYVDGVPFMNAFDVKPADGRVVIFNYEVSDNQFLSWLDRVGIENQQAVTAVNLRGKGFYIQDDDACEWAIKMLRQAECEIWEIDPLSAAIRGNTNDTDIASDWISRAERIKAEAGITDLVLTTHTGHLSNFDANGRAGNERTAGAARWMGWPDCLWTYTKDAEEHRYLSVYGRDVECDEYQVLMDKETIRLTDQGRGTSRIAGKDQRLWKKLIEAVSGAMPEGAQATALKALSSKSSDVSRLRSQGVEMGAFEEVIVPNGKRGANPTFVRLTPLGETIARQLGN